MSDSAKAPAIAKPAMTRTAPQRSPTSPSDPRALRSREALRNALLRLVEARHLDKVTLREITAEAGVSYPTFFNHYDSKEALFHEIVRTEIVEFMTAGFQDGTTAPDWRPGVSICAFVAARRSLWRTLLTTGASEAMRSEFIRYGRTMPRRQNVFGHGFPIDVISAVIASGVFEVIAWWLAQDPAYPAAPIADMLETLIVEPVLGLRSGFFTDRADGTRAPDR